MSKKSNIISFNSYKRKRQGRAGAQSGPFKGSEDSSQEAIKLKDPNERDWQGRTALHRAAEAGDKERAEKLVSAGADPNIKDKNGYSPLHFAAMAGGALAAQALIEGGAKLDARTNDGKTPIDCAKDTNQAETFRILKEAAGKGSAAAGPAREMEKSADPKAPGPPPPNIIFMNGRQNQNSAQAGSAGALPAGRLKDGSADLPRVIFMDEYLERKKPPEWDPFPEERIPEDSVPPRKSWGWQASAAVSAAVFAALFFTVSHENKSSRGIASKPKPKLSNPSASLTAGRRPTPEESEEFERLDQTARSPQSLNRGKILSPSEYAKLLGGGRLLRSANKPLK